MNTTKVNTKKLETLIVENKSYKPQLIIIYAILLQLITALFIIWSDDPIRVARLDVFYNLFPNYGTGVALMLVGVIMAVVGLTRKRSDYKFLLFLPQFAFLLLTAGSALYHVIQGHYADGVIRPWYFIFVDQLPSFIAATLYTFAIFDFRKDGDGKPS